MLFSHFTAALLFAFFTSVVFAVTGKETNRERLLYGFWVFGLFVVISLGVAWLMAFLHH